MGDASRIHTEMQACHEQERQEWVRAVLAYEERLSEAARMQLDSIRQDAGHRFGQCKEQAERDASTQVGATRQEFERRLATVARRADEFQHNCDTPFVPGSSWSR